jgi:hypothetical protein
MASERTEVVVMPVRSLGLILVSLALACTPKSSAPSAAAGGNGSSSGGDAATQSCSTLGATQACCGSGTQICSGVEFPTWGPCRGADGATLTCGQGDCASNELSSCDGGTTLPPEPALCTAGGANNEPEILVGYAPANGQSVGAGGQIKVWVNDEGAPIIAPGELVDATSGAITTPGDRTAKAPDGYLWEPALYIAPQSAENGGMPHFPSFIHGDYNNTTKKGGGLKVAGLEPAPAGSQPLQEQYTAEFVWNVDSLGLAPGSYIAEFVIHDGDRDRGIGCVTITIN